MVNFDRSIRYCFLADIRTGSSDFVFQLDGGSAGVLLVHTRAPLVGELRYYEIVV